MELSTFILIIFGMLTLVNVIYKKVFYPELKEVDKEPDEIS